METTPLYTKVNIENPRFSISYNNSVFFLGSCFATHIGQRLHRLKYPTTINPFGVLYNPASVSAALQRLVQKKPYSIDELVKHANIWLSFDHYTRFSGTDKNAVIDDINRVFTSGAEDLQKASVLFLTFGTAWVYRLKQNHKIVANCHKVPANEFERELLTVDQIVHLLRDALLRLQESNGGIKIVTTISPIRHWKDGAVGNQRSKARLVLALEEISRQIPETYYFPVYELFMDEFRDYRYYADDMLHPSTFAIQRVWEYFAETFIHSDDLKWHKPIDNIQRMLEHRIVTHDTLEQAEFKKKIAQKIHALQKQNPNIDWSGELALTQIERLPDSNPSE